MNQKITNKKMVEYYYNKLYESKPEYSGDDIYTIVKTKIYKQLPLSVVWHIADVFYIISLRISKYGLGTRYTDYNIGTPIEENTTLLGSDLDEEKEVEMLMTLDSKDFEEFYLYMIENLSKRTHEKIGDKEYNKIGMIKGIRQEMGYMHDALMFYIDLGETRKYIPIILKNTRKAYEENGIGTKDEIKTVLLVLDIEMDTREDIREENRNKIPHVSWFVEEE